MSKKVNPAAVGVFVAGALVVLLAGLVVLGSGKWFEKRGAFVVYFQASANGLQEGADVLLGGVKVGSVERMQVQLDPATRQKVIRVVIELSADRLAALTFDSTYSRDDILSPESMKRAIDELGLRARLMTKSVLTGQLFVDLDFFPEDEDSYRFPQDPADELIQIPSTKNEIQRVLDSIAEGVNKLSSIDFAGTMENLDKLVVNLNQSVEDLDMAGISERAKKTLDGADSALTSVEKLVSDGKIKDAIASFEAVATKLGELVDSIDDDAVSALLADASDTIQQAGKTLREIEVAAANIAENTTPDAAVVVRLNRTLAGIEEATRAVKDLAEYLKRNPNALISGKKRP